MLDTELIQACASLPKRLLAGLSGGADSVALLLALRETCGELTAVHVHHGLRGADADADEAFVRALCLRLGVPLLVYHLAPPEGAGETWAREARYTCFRKAMAVSGADALALAHQQDDQAETMLMHLMRGSGLDGIAGMQADAVTGGMRIVRPLLAFSHCQLCAFLNGRGQSWREDATNSADITLRNRLRRHVFPLLESLSPGAVRRMAEAADRLRADAAALDSMTSAFLSDSACAGSDWLSLSALHALPANGLRIRVLRRWAVQRIEGSEQALSAMHTQALLALTEMKNGSTHTLPGGWCARIGWRCIHLISGSRTQPAPVPFTARTFTWQDIAFTAEHGLDFFGDGLRSQAVPNRLLSGLTLRCWQQGDWIRPFGGPGKKSLQDYLTDRHIDAPFRHRIPLICRDSEVLWAVGVGAGSLPLLCGDEDFTLLCASGVMPWRDVPVFSQASPRT